jgi:biotin carboxylase
MSPKEKSILIFGAGINQLELIREANNLGITSIVIDPQPDPPGKILADFFYQVEGKDYEASKAIALKHKVNAIVTGQLEKPMRLMARLAKELDLKFHSPEVVERSLDKWLMKQAFIEKQVPCAKGLLFNKDEDITENSLRQFPFPLIIKPKDATSSQGVYRIEHFADIEKYTTIARSFSKTGEILIEEFLDGPELSVEAITFHGKTHIVQYTEKFVTPFPRTVEMGHLQPAELNDGQKKEVSRVVASAIKAIGIDDSASHTEVKLTSAGPKIVEIGARLGGDFIASYLTKSSTGISMDRAAVQVALSWEPDLRQTKNKYSYIRYLELEPGNKVKNILPLDDLRQLQGVVFARMFVRPGDTIHPVIHSALRSACLLVEGASRSEVMRLADEYMPLLEKKIQIMN